MQKNKSHQKVGFAVAIDGPVASGKGTIASRLADRLSGFYLYTGSMYRCIALYCIKKSIPVTNETAVENVLKSISIEFKEDKILLNGTDVCEEIKQKEIAMAGSTVSLYKGVRKDMVRRQQEIAYTYMKRGEIVVAEGRDIGTRVLQNAALQSFLYSQQYEITIYFTYYRYSILSTYHY